MILCWQVMTSLAFYDLWPIWSNDIPDAWCVKLTFSLLRTFYFTKTESRTKNLYDSFHTIALSKGTIFDKNAERLKENANIIKINGS